MSTGKIRYEQLDRDDIALNLAAQSDMIILQNTVAANKDDYTTQLAAANNLDMTAINAASTALQAQIVSSANGLSATITANQSEIQSQLNSAVSTLNDSITAGNTLSASNLTAAQNTLGSEIAANLVAVNTEIAAEISARQADTATKALAGGSASQDFVAQNLTVTGNILASGAGQTIGTLAQPFSTIYVNEAKLSVNTLYLGETAILGTTDTTVNIQADPDQSILMKTTGLGYTQIQSDKGIDINTVQPNANINITAIGAGADVLINGANEVNIQAPNTFVSGALNVTGALSAANVTITGNLNVTGTTTTVNSQNLLVSDNIINLNENETGNGVSAGQAGIKIMRGQGLPYMMLFDEPSQSFQVGMQGQLLPVATQSYVNTVVKPAIESDLAALNGVSQATLLAKIGTLNASQSATLGVQLNPVSYTSNGLMIDTDKVLFDAIPATYAAMVHNHVKANITDFAHTHPYTDLSGVAATVHTHVKANITDFPVNATETVDGFMCALDKIKLDNLASTYAALAHTHVKANITDFAHFHQFTDLIGVAATVHTHVKANITDFPVNATETVDGFMCALDKIKLDGIAIGANNYILPATLPAEMIVADANNRFVTDAEIATWNALQPALGYTAENVANKGIVNGYVPLDNNGKIPLSYIPNTAREQTYVVSTHAATLALSGIVTGDRVYETVTGDSYVWDGTQWDVASQASWANVNLQWTNIVGTPSTVAGYGITNASLVGHTHLKANITDLGEVTETADGLMIAADKVKVDNLSSTYAALVHNHDASYLKLVGGEAVTGLVNFTSGLQSNGVNVATVSQIPTTLPANGGTAANVSGVVAIANGGTGSNTAAGAQAALGLNSLATQNAAAVAITGGTLSGVTITSGSVVYATYAP